MKSNNITLLQSKGVVMPLGRNIKYMNRRNLHYVLIYFGFVFLGDFKHHYISNTENLLLMNLTKKKTFLISKQE